MFAMTLLGFTISTIWAVFIMIIWIAIAFWPARVAGRKGHSFLGYFIFSLFFFPLALLVAYLSTDQSAPAPPPAPIDE
jgi:hypothetical protein